MRLYTITDLEKLITHPDTLYRQEHAHEYTIGALRTLVKSNVLPTDISTLLAHILELHKKASNPFLGMNLPTKTESE